MANQQNAFLRAQAHHELISQCKEQLKFLIKSCNEFDRGDTSEAKRLAATIRLLIHDTRNSISLFTQLGMKKTPFYESSINPPEEAEQSVQLFAQLSLVGRLAGNPTHFYSPHLGEPIQTEKVDFDSWWSKIVIADKDGNLFSRKDIILTMADQDGGAHVDPKLGDLYYKLTRLNSVQDTFMMLPGGDLTVGALLSSTPTKPPVSPAFYTVRQIAHEILVSKLVATREAPRFYTYDENHYNGLAIAFLGLHDE